MTTHSEQERLLVHDTVAITVDTIVAAIQQEIARARQELGDEGLTRLETKFRQGVLAGLRDAESAAAVASVAARAAAMHTQQAAA